MNKQIGISILILLALLCTNCTTTKVFETSKIKIDTTVVVPPTIKDSLNVYWEADKAIAVKVENQDTTQKVWFEPSPVLLEKIKDLGLEKDRLTDKLGKFHFEIKPDTIELISIDTVYQATFQEECTITDKLGLIFIGFIIAVLVVAVILIKIKLF